MPENESSAASTLVVVGLWVVMVVMLLSIPYCAKRQSVQPPPAEAPYDDGTPHLVVLSKRLPFR